MIHLASDLHLEFLSDNTLKKRIKEGFYENKTGAKILILAGDVTPDLRQYRTFLDYVANEYQEVIAVAGNHEFYGKNFYTQTKKLKTLFSVRHNTHFLDCETITLLGKTFFGGTAWTDLNQNVLEVYQGMNDFVTIKGKHKPADNPYGRYSETWSVKEWREQHTKFRVALANQTKDIDVVISHHLPDMALIAGEFKYSSLNAGYASNDMKTLLSIPKYWVFGHTHTPLDVVLQGTRFLCNPVGYYNHEISQYNNELEIVI